MGISRLQACRADAAQSEVNTSADLNFKSAEVMLVIRKTIFSRAGLFASLWYEKRSGQSEVGIETCDGSALLDPIFVLRAYLRPLDSLFNV